MKESSDKLIRRSFLAGAISLAVPRIVLGQEQTIDAKARRKYGYSPMQYASTYLQVDNLVYDISQVSPLDGEGMIALIIRTQGKYFPEVKIRGNSLNKSKILFNHMNNGNSNNGIGGISFDRDESIKIGKEKDAMLRKNDPQYGIGYFVPVLTKYKTLEEALRATK